MNRVVVALTALLLASGHGYAQGLSPQNDSEALPDLRIGIGEHDVAQAWFVKPTNRYRHHVLGNPYEAGGLRVALRSGEVVTLSLEDTEVFEDRQPRVADLDGDGRDEIIVVQTSTNKGASLAAYGVENNALTLKAKTPYIGRAFRWLNPAGIADFDGDGKLDVAFVAMPHLTKRLEVWTLNGSTFEQWGAYAGFSNHRNGSPHTDMSVVADFNDDGVADLALPGAERRAIKFLSLKDRSLELVKSAPLPAEADGPFSLTENAIIVRLSTGARVAVDR